MTSLRTNDRPAAVRSERKRRETFRRRMLLESLDQRQVMAADTSLYGTLTFDFGTNQSPVEANAVQVSDTVRYSAQRGYGLLAPVNAVDRGQADDLHRDFVAAKKVSFRFDLPNGLYQVEPGLGDRTRLRDRVQVAINGEVRDEVTSLGGTPTVPSYYVEVKDGILLLEVTDLGGDSQNAALTSLTVTALDDSYGIPDDRPAQAINQSPLLVIATHGRVSPASQGRLLSTPDRKDRPEVPEWIYDSARAMAKATRAQSLGDLDPNVRPILLPKIEAATTDEQLRALQKGSPDFIALDWTRESSFGTPQGAGDVLSDPGDVYNEIQHRKAVTRSAVALFRMLELRIHQELQDNPSAKVDLLIVGHSFGTVVNREVLMMLNQSELAEHVDFVKIVELDPVAMKADTDPSERADSHDRYFWAHPDMARGGRPVADSVVSYYQTEGLAFTGILEKGLIMGLPLDGKDGGGLLGFRNGSTMVFDTATGETIDGFKNLRKADGKPTEGDLRDAVYSPDGKLIAIASEDGTVRIRDARTHIEIRSIPVSTKSVTDVTFLPQSDSIVVVSRDGKVRIFRVDNGQELWEGEHKRNAEQLPDGTLAYRGAQFVAVSADAKLIVTGGTADHIKIWLRKPGTGVSYTHVQSLPSHAQGTTSIAIAADGTVVTGGNDGKLRVWKQGKADYELSQTLDLVSDIHRVVFSEDGRLLAVAAGRTVSLYMRGQNGALIRTHELRDHVDAVYGLAFTKNGAQLATGGMDHTIFLYDTATAQKVKVLNQAMLGVRTLAYSADGSRLLATYFDLKGGPVKDINVTEQVRSRVGLIENIASGGSEHHNEVPFVFIDLVILKTNDSFFEMRDKPRASRYGDFEPGDLTKWDVNAVGADEVFGDSDDALSKPWLDELTNLHAPVFTRNQPTTTVFDDMTISLEGLAVDPDGNPFTWSVRSSNPQVMQAVIEQGTLRLRPIKEGTSEIELTANDGRWAAQIRFAAIADGTLWRNRANELKQQTRQAIAELDAIEQQINRTDDALSQINDQWRQVEDKLDRLQSDIEKLGQELNTVTARVNRLQRERDPIAAAKAAADAALSSAEAAFRSASSDYSRLDAQTRQLYQTYQQRQNERQAAKQRLDNANKNNKQSRQAEFNSAAAAAAQAEQLWRNSQTQRDAAERTLEASRRQRDNLASDAVRQANRLAQADRDLSRALAERSSVSADFSAKLELRDARIAELARLRASTSKLSTQHQSLSLALDTANKALQSLAQTLSVYQQTKWVTDLGLEKTDRELLTPASKRVPSLKLALSGVSDRISRIDNKIAQTSNRLSSLG